MKDYLKKAEEIVDKLTLEELVKFIYGNGFWKTNGNSKYGIKELTLSDGPHGLRRSPDNTKVLSYSLPATCFPTGSSLACSFNTSLLEKVGKAIAEEAIQVGVDIVLGPGLNIKRNPLCGRNFEYFSEDPYLSGKLGASYVKGLQSLGVGATIKHFAVNNQENNRMLLSANVDERALNEIYLKQFEIVIKEANPWAIMCSYNKVNGVYSSDNRYLLSDILRDHFNFKGVVMSDWGAMNDLSKSYHAGLDLEMPCPYPKYKQIIKEIKKGNLDLNDVKRAAKNVIALALKSAGEKKTFELKHLKKEHFLLAKEVALESMVLVKNNGLLPLNLKISDVGVVGNFAKFLRIQGCGSSCVNPIKNVSFLHELNANKIDYKFAEGYLLDDTYDETLINEAVEVAKSVKTLIVFLGTRNEEESEGYDRPNMRLNDTQIKLIDALSEVNKNIIVVLSTGSPVELPFIHKVNAVVLSYLSGEASGAALFDLLFGIRSFSGKLAETWPINYESNIFYKDYLTRKQNVNYYDSIFVGYRYFDIAKKDVMFPFGFGLSYAQFKYSNYRLDFLDLSHYRVTINVTNISDIDASEIVQFYIGQNNPKTFKAVRELCDFKKVYLKAHQSIDVSFDLDVETLKHFDLMSHRYVLEAGYYRFEVGASSRDIKASVNVYIKSDDYIDSFSSLCPSYYQLEKVEEIKPSEFATLLQKDLPIETESKRPFTRSSSIRDIQKTLIGKIMIKEASKTTSKETDIGRKHLMEESLLDTPLRCISLSGMFNDTGINGIVDMANKKWFRGTLKLLRGRNKCGR